MKVAAPVIARLPLSDISPVVAVPLKVPPIVDAAKFKFTSFTMVTAPVPWGARVNAPVTARSFRVITLWLASVVALRVPFTVTVELSVSVIVPPLRKVKLPSMVDAPMIKFVVPPSILTSASLSLLVSLVVINNWPVNALVSVVKTMSAPTPEVTRVVAPAIARAPLCVMFPSVAVAVSVPSTVDAANRSALSFLIVALPDDPSVFKATAPVNVLSASFNVIVALLALVVKVEVVPTANSEP